MRTKRGSPTPREDDLDLAPIYLRLRDAITTVSPSAHGLAPTAELPRVWGAMIDVGLPPGPVTVVAIADGTTSLYQGNGGATLGTGDVPSVAEPSRALLLALESAVPELAPDWRYPLPPAGWVQVVGLTYQGMLVGRASMAELASGRHPLSEVWARTGRVAAAVTELGASVRANRTTEGG